MTNSEIIDQNFDVNSELYFNEKFNLWLNKQTSEEVKLILTNCFDIPMEFMSGSSIIYPWDTSDAFYPRAIRFDQKIEFSNNVCVIFELKVGPEIRIGQLDNYLTYLRDKGYQKGFVIHLSRNKLAAKQLGIDTLAKCNPNLLFFTWNKFETTLKQLLKGGKLKSPKKLTEQFLHLLTFLTDIAKRSEKLIIKPSPESFDYYFHIASLVEAAPPKRSGSFLVWGDRNQFWSELIAHATSHSGLNSFCAYRFDFYDYLTRWAFHIKKVYLDIYEDKNYEYLYNYFIKNIYPNKGNLPSVQISELYYRYLLIRREKEVLSINSHKIFFKKFRKDWYVYILENGYSGSEIPYLKCYELQFSV